MTSTVDTQDLINSILNDPTKIGELDDDEIENAIKNMTDEQATQLRGGINPYGRTITNKEKFVCFSHTNLSENYMRKFTMTSLIGFLYRMLSEYNPDDHPQTEGTMNKEDLLDFKDKCRAFFDTQFEFNPDDHVRSAASPDKGDPDRKTHKEIRRKHGKISAAEFKEFKKQRREALKEGKTLESVNEDGVEISEENIAHELDKIPPADTFHRWEYYTDVNFEELRDATHSLYRDKPDLDVMVNIYDQFDSEEKANEFKSKYGEELRTSINVAMCGQWILLGSFKENRKRMDFYNKNTEIIKRIIEQNEMDKRLGQDMMKKRIHKKKAQNIRQDGPDAKGLSSYSQTFNNTESAGADKVIKEEDAKKLNEMFARDEGSSSSVPAAHAQTYDDVPDDAVQVDVFINDGHGGFKKDRIFTQAEAPDTDTIHVTQAHG